MRQPLSFERIPKIDNCIVKNEAKYERQEDEKKAKLVNTET